ncbi:unnamed protein product, partial [Lymnaea stagnalis]
PDITLISNGIETNTKWNVLGDIGSDHLPIQLCIKLDNTQDEIQEEDGPLLWQYTKADCALFAKTGDTLLKETNNLVNNFRTLDQKYDNWTNCVLKAAATAIPRLRKHHNIKTQNLQITKLSKMRNHARSLAPTSKLNRLIYNNLTRKLRLLSIKLKREQRKKLCENINLRKNPTKAWAFVKRLTGETKKNNPSPIVSEGKTYVEDKRRAEILNILHQWGKQKNDQERKRMEKEIKIDDASIMSSPFTQNEIQRAIAQCKKNTAAGADKISTNMLKNIGPKTRTYLLDIINESWKRGEIPNIWRHAIITPILKEGKNPTEAENCLPISITSCVGKIAERMVNNRMYWFLEGSDLIHPDQSGFRHNRQSIDQVVKIILNIQDGFQSKENTV